MCFCPFQLSLTRQEQACVISPGLKSCRCKSLLFYKLSPCFISQALAGLNSLTLSHWGAVRVNALNDKSLRGINNSGKPVHVSSYRFPQQHGMGFVFSGGTSVTSLFGSNEYVLMPSFPVASEAPFPTPAPAQGHLPVAHAQFWFSSLFFFLSLQEAKTSFSLFYKTTLNSVSTLHRMKVN